MKYKLFLIIICIIRIETKPTESKPKKWNEINSEPHIPNFQPNTGPTKHQQLGVMIKVDKHGNKWAFDENSREWMHLPKQQINPMMSSSSSSRIDDYPVQSLPGMISPMNYPRGQPSPGKIVNNNPSIYGPHFPNSFQPIKRPNEDYENEQVGPLAHSSPIYGPLPLPAEFDPTEEDDLNGANNVMTWQHPFNNFSNNNFPIPGGPIRGGPKYPGPLDNIGKPSTQYPVRSTRYKASTLEEFEDPFELEFTNTPKNVKSLQRLSTTTFVYEDQDYHPFPTLEPVLDDQIIELAPIFSPNDESEDEPENRPKQQTTKKANRKPIVKIPIGPQEPPNLWTSFNQRTTIPPSTTTQLVGQNNQKNANNDLVELFPPVPPEQPGNVDDDNTPATSSSTNDMIHPNNIQKEIPNLMTSSENPTPIIITTTVATTTTTTTEPTTTQTSTVPSIPSSTSTSTSESTTFMTEPSTMAQTQAPTNPTTIVNNPNPPLRPTLDPWRPITLGKRHQTPVPIIEYPMMSASVGEVWRPVMGPYSPVKVPQVEVPLREDSNWIRPTMGSMSGNIINIMPITIRKGMISTTTLPPMTTTLKMSSTVGKRKVIKKKIIKTTTESTTSTTTSTTTTTTESPKPIPKLKVTKRSKKTTTLSPTTTESTTTTESPTTTVSTTVEIRRLKKLKKLKTLSITTTTTPQPSTEPIGEMSDDTEDTIEKNESNSGHIIEESRDETIEEEKEQTLETNQGANTEETLNIETNTEPEYEDDIEETTIGITSENPKENAVQNNVEEVEEEEENEEIITETTTEAQPQENTHEVIETEEINDEEISDEENEVQTITPPITQSTPNTNVEEVEEEEEEVEEESPAESGAQKEKENVKDDRHKEDNNTEEVIEYEYIEVTEEPILEPTDTEVEEIEEEVFDDTPEVETTTKAVPKINDNWNHISFPMKRKESPNLFPLIVS